MRYGKIIEITNEYGANDSDVIVYTKTEDNAIIGLYISKCYGFIPKIGYKVKITNGDMLIQV